MKWAASQYFDLYDRDKDRRQNPISSNLQCGPQKTGVGQSRSPSSAIAKATARSHSSRWPLSLRVSGECCVPWGKWACRNLFPTMAKLEGGRKQSTPQTAKSYLRPLSEYRQGADILARHGHIAAYLPCHRPDHLPTRNHAFSLANSWASASPLASVLRHSLSRPCVSYFPRSIVWQASPRQPS